MSIADKGTVGLIPVTRIGCTTAHFPHLLLLSFLTLWAPVVLKVVLVKVPPSGSVPWSCAGHPTIHAPHDRYHLLLLHPSLLTPFYQHSASNRSFFLFVPSSLQPPTFPLQPHRWTLFVSMVIPSTCTTLPLLCPPHLLCFCLPWPRHSVWTTP